MPPSGKCVFSLLHTTPAVCNICSRRHYQRDPGELCVQWKVPKAASWEPRIWGRSPWWLLFFEAAFHLLHVPSGRKNKRDQTVAPSSHFPSKRSILNPHSPRRLAPPDRKMKMSSPLCFMTFTSKLKNLTHCQSPLLLQN